MADISTTLRLYGEAEYKAGLRNASAEVKTLDAELKNLTAEYEANDKSAESLAKVQDKLSEIIEALSKKQELLAKAIENAESKQKTVSKSADEAREAYAEAARALEEYKNAHEGSAEGAEDLKQALDKAEAAVKSKTKAELNAKTAVEDLKRQQAELNGKLGEAKVKMQNLGKETGGFADKSGIAADAADALGQKIISAFSFAGVVEIIRQISQEIADMIETTWELTDNIGIATGATGEELANMVAMAKEVKLTIPEASISVEDLSTAIGEINTRFGTTGSDLESMTRKFAVFASVTGTDATSNVRNVSQLMAQWGLDSAQLSHTLDSLVVAAQKSGASVSDLSTIMTKNAVSLSELGFSYDEALALMSNFELRGINIEQAMSGMRQATVQLTKSGTDGKQALADLSEQLKACGSDAQATQIAVKYFGTEAGALFATSIRNGTFAVDELAASLEGADGAANQTYETLKNAGDIFGNVFDPAMQAFKLFGESAYESSRDAIDAANADAKAEKARAEAYENLRREYERLLPPMAEGVGVVKSTDEAMTDWGNSLSVAADSITGDLAELEASYQSHLDAARNSIDSVISGFAAMETVVPQSVANTIAALESQAKYLTDYQDNLIAAKDLGMSDELLAQLSDGSVESAKILAGIVEDVTAGKANIADLNEAFATVGEKKKELSETIADMAVNYADSMQEIKDRTDDMVDNMSQYDAACAAGQKTMSGYIDGLQSKYHELVVLSNQIEKLVSGGGSAGASGSSSSGTTVNVNQTFYGNTDKNTATSVKKATAQLAGLV